MAKLERLVTLAGLIDTHRPVSIAQMSRACGVSQRTVYRYLRALSGIRLAARTATKAAPDLGSARGGTAFEPEDWEILRFALSQNPLVRHPCFRERVQAVRERLERVVGPAHDPPRLRLMSVESAGETKVAPSEARLVGDFVRCAESGFRIRLHLRSGPVRHCTGRPCGLAVSGELTRLQVEDCSRGRTSWFDVEDVVRAEALDPAGDRLSVPRTVAKKS